MLCLNIRQQYAKIAIQTQSAKLQLQSFPAKLQMESQPARVEIRQAKGELEIDSAPWRESIGYRGLLAFARYNAEQGRQTALETIGQLAAEGDRMGWIESGEKNVIANMAAENNIPDSGNLVLAPTEARVIRYHFTPAQFDPIPGKINYNATPGRVEGEFTPGRVTAPISQYQSIRTWVTEGKYDLSV